MGKSLTVADKDIQRKRDKTSEAARVTIPPVADPARRAACLADPVLFLRTYNAKGEEGFTTPFAEHHLAMIHAIDERARTGGDKAVAAPRGDGKSSVAVWMLIYIILAGNCRSAVIIAATRKHAQKLFKRFKKAFLFNDLLAADFPEISACVRDLDGAPQRAAKQHVDGQKTQIVWTQDDVTMPHTPDSDYGGIRIAYYGLDSAIRGGRFHFALIDDPETKAVAESDEQNLKVEEMIDSDVAGLAFPDSSITRVILTTVQNRRCYSYRVTDPKVKPAFAGKRYGMLKTWPTNRDLWDEYVALRQIDQEGGDKDGTTAMQFFLDNREAMEEGATVTNPFRFDKKSETEICALQAFWNRVADWKMPRVLSELQNDPEPEETEEVIGLTAGKVQTRISGLAQHEMPRADRVLITTGIDIGNFNSHWVKVAWFGNATGCVIDYGVMETADMSQNADAELLTRKLVPSLRQWRAEITAENPPEFGLVDSGSGMHKEAVYEFIRQSGGGILAPSKGIAASRFNSGKDTSERRLFQECYAQLQSNERLWLYNVNTEFWKQWLQERFLIPTFNEAMQFNDGGLSLYSPTNPKQHVAFAHHMVAEERQSLFIAGKGMQVKWVVKSKNNHWLDALALACCAAAVMGVRLIQQVQPEPQKRADPKPQGESVFHMGGQPLFRSN